MGAEDTVKGIEEIWKVIFDVPVLDDKWRFIPNLEERRLNAVANAQAEISFKAGIKEVIMWQRTHMFPPHTQGDEECWQAQLKVWGFK